MSASCAKFGANSLTGEALKWLKFNEKFDTIRYTIFTCFQMLTNSQLDLPHGTKQKKSNEETKNKKTKCSEETVQS